MDHYLNALKHKYALFEGRARREEYWMFQLFHLVVLFSLVIVEFIFIYLTNELYPAPILSFIYVVAAFIPGLAIYVRRLHDTGKSGWLILIGLIPLAGIILFVFTVMEGDRSDNEYGPDPKTINDEYDDWDTESYENRLQ